MLWMYLIPNWLLCVIMLLTFTGVSMLGLWLTRPWVRSFRSHHNEIVGFFMGGVGITYAVLLAMIAVAAWSNYTIVEGMVAQEADVTSEIFRKLELFPHPCRDNLCVMLHDSTAAVVSTEWPAMQHGNTDKRALLMATELFDAVRSFTPESETERKLQSEVLDRLDTLHAVRRNRTQAGSNGLAPVLWLVVIAGALLNILLSYLFQIENHRLHQTLTAVFSLSLGIIVYLIASLDHPLWGEVSVSPEPLASVVEMMDHRLHPDTPGQIRHLPSHP
jgi:ABC-type multidrug transport system fused ATPase/permease subunit